MPVSHGIKRANYLKSKKRDLRNRDKKRSPLLRFAKLFLFIVILILLYTLIRQNSRDWDGKNRLAIVYPTTSGNVEITIFDPSITEITTLIIPGDTQVDVASNYGSLRIKNIWQLGINEKKYGGLLAKTVSKNFLTPVYLWSDKDAEKLRTLNINGLIRFVFLPSSTNIAFGDRLRMAFYSLKINNIDKIEINLGDSQFLEYATLNDGLPGYVVSESNSNRLAVFFIDPNFTTVDGSVLRARIIDGTGVPGVAQKIGEIIEVLGAKVVSVDKSRGVTNNNCEIKGTVTKEVLTKISKMFGCKIISDPTEFDLEFSIGSEFNKYF